MPKTHQLAEAEAKIERLRAALERAAMRLHAMHREQRGGFRECGRPGCQEAVALLAQPGDGGE